MSAPTPSDIMQAHQYLYYVRCAPVLSDYEYDRFCQECGLEGGGGSDLASDYPPHIVALANTLSSTSHPAK
jgi:NAD-dependent DNA ligase